MCKPENLNIVASALLVARVVISSYLLVEGSILAANVHLAQAFGSGVAAIGGCLIVVGIFGVCSAAINKIGSLKHNKFVLCIYLCCDGVLLAAQFALGVSLFAYTNLDFDSAFQLDCLRSVPALHTDAECSAYIRSDRYAAMLLVWRSFTSLSVESATYYSLANGLENSCCGFGPPMRCTDDPRAFPSYASTSQVGWDADVRYECGPEPDWYAETYYCTQYLDSTAIDPVLGGCRYDDPVGNCADVTPAAATLGCARAVEAYVIGEIGGHAVAVMVLTAATAAGLAAACCLFWKRTRADPMPDPAERLPWDPYGDVADGDGGMVPGKLGVGGGAGANAGGWKWAAAGPTRRARGANGGGGRGGAGELSATAEELSLTAMMRVHPV